MGYRSDVMFSTTRAGYDEFLSYLPEELLRGRWGLFSSEGVPEVLDIEGDSVVFGWHDVKWYEDWGLNPDGSDPFADVHAVMRAFHEVFDNGRNPISYARVGEDYDDVEVLDGDIDAVLERKLGVRSAIFTW